MTPAERDAAAAMAIWLTVAALCRYYAAMVWVEVSYGFPALYVPPPWPNSDRREA